MNARHRRALKLPSGAVYQTGAFTWVERWAIFSNARLDLIEYMNANGRDCEQIARTVSISSRAVGELIDVIESRAKCETTEPPPPKRCGQCEEGRPHTCTGGE